MLTFDQELKRDIFEQDFELFTLTNKSIDQSRTHFSIEQPLSVINNTTVSPIVDSYGAEAMTESLENEDTWLAWGNASHVQDSATLPLYKANPSVSDSGYGSVDCAGCHNTEVVTTAQLDRDSQYCETCYKDSERRRYFNNNADRR
jgi:hypothetical protein